MPSTTPRFCRNQGGKSITIENVRKKINELFFNSCRGFYRSTPNILGSLQTTPPILVIADPSLSFFFLMSACAIRHY